MVALALHRALPLLLRALLPRLPVQPLQVGAAWPRRAGMQPCTLRGCVGAFKATWEQQARACQ